ncbi:MAG: tetratricopeptide repeat protein [Kiritimatiellaceae bacterium]|nr:tetratricopeptide repeat protein [Kiritimatiellaceae bacterium]
MSVKTSGMKRKSNSILWVLGVAGWTTLFFLPILHGEFLHWDDQALFVENPYFRGLGPSHWQWMCTTFLLGHWQPLSWLSYAVDYKIWAMNPQGWHATNLLLHSVNAVLVYLSCLSFFGGRKEQSRMAAALAALFWAIHPLRGEPVAWLATRGYLLCTTFCLLTLLLYLRAVGRSRYPLAALLCFALASGTKGIGMMLPPVLLLVDWVLLRRVTSVRTACSCTIEKIPFFGISLLTGLAAFWSKHLHGGMASVEQYGLRERFGQAIYGIWFYLLKTITPHNLSPLYYQRPEAGPVMVALVLAVTTVIFLFLFRRNFRPVIFALSAFLLLVFPMLGFTQSGAQMVADRFTYLAAVPFSVLLAVGLNRLTAFRRTVFTALAVLLIIFGVQTFIWSGVWSDSLLLWHHSATAGGGDARAYNGMGQALMDRKAYTKSIECFDQALRLKPNYAAALQNRALARIETGEYRKAFEDVGAALSMEGLSKVDQVKMRLGQGRIAEHLGLTDQVLVAYSAVIDDPAVDPFWKIQALQMRARIYLERGHLAQGRLDLEAVLRLPDPTDEYQSRVRRVLAELKKIPEE